MYPMDFKEFLMATENNLIIKEIRKCFETNTKVSEPLHEKLLKYYRYYLCTGDIPEIVFNFTKEKQQILNKKTDDITSIKYIEKYKPNYAIRISTKNFGFENNIKSVPLYAVFCIDKNI